MIDLKYRLYFVFVLILFWYTGNNIQNIINRQLITFTVKE